MSSRFPRYLALISLSCLMSAPAYENSQKPRSFSVPVTSKPDGDLKILVVSDIHYCGSQPFKEGPSEYRKDTTTALLSKTLDAMHHAVPDPAFIVIPGDLVAHSAYKDPVTHKGVPACKSPIEDSEKSKVFNDVLKQIEDKFETTPIVTALGNNDTDGLDYHISRKFLEATESKVCEALRDPSDSNCNQEYPRKGSYRVLLSLGNKRVRVEVAAVNTMSLALGSDCGEYPWSLPEALTSPPAPLIVLGHIPPGLNTYSNNSPFYTCHKREFMDSMKTNTDRMHFAIFGHTHRNEIRALTWDSQAKSSDSSHGETTSSIPILIAPSVSPIYDNNPGFLEITVNSDMNISDYVSHYLRLEPENKDRQSCSHFCEAESFATMYPSTLEGGPVTPNAIMRLQATLTRDPEERGRYRLSRCDYRTVCASDDKENGSVANMLVKE